VTEKIDLREIQRSVYRATYEDGLYDISLGVIVLAMGLNPYLSISGLPKPLNYLLLPLIALLISFIGKRKITYPRMGSFSFGKQGPLMRKGGWQLAAIIIPIQIIFILLIRSGSFLQNSIPDIQRYSGPLVTAAAFTLIATIISRLIEYYRLSIYGVMIGLAIITAEILFLQIGSPLDGLIPFSICGFLILIYGLLRFRRFLKMYPEPSGKTDDVELL